MIPLLVIRHGRTSWNAAKKLQGLRDIPLSPEGRTLLGKSHIPPEFLDFKWVTSPLIRAQQTAEILGGTALEIAPDLIEMNWGDWEEHTISELRQKYGPAMAENEKKGLHMRPDGGESPFEVQQRLLPFLKNLKHPTIAVTHKGVIRALKSLAYQWDMTDKSPVSFDWGSAHLFQIDEDGIPHADRVNIKLDTE
jgi:broad specificity phosphatase PhoE